MNRDKKQLVVIGVLVLVIISVGAFQFMAKPGETPPAAAKKEAKPTAADEAKKKAETPLLNPQYGPLVAKDPFQIAPFVADNDPTLNPPKPPVITTTQVGGTGLTAGQKDKIKPLPVGNSEIWRPEPVTGTVAPEKVEQVPVFGYNLIGIVEGAYPMAVFDDGKGNQQLVEVGHGVGTDATVLSISRGKVRVKFNAQTLTFNVGGNSNAK